MLRNGKQLARMLLFASALVPPVPLLLVSLQLQAQAPAKGIDAALPGLLAKAKAGDASAQWTVGGMYEYGIGVPQDYALAAQWFRKAAEQGDAEAQFNLGLVYSRGSGVPQDYAEAYFWLDLAAAEIIDGVKQDDVNEFRDNAASHLTPADLSRVQERARKWFEDHPAKPQ